MGTLRLLLALAVLLGHAPVPFGGIAAVHASTAVQLFYLVSGFYMGLVLRTKYRPGDYGRFLVARWLRIVPAYTVVLASTIGWQLVLWARSGQPAFTLAAWHAAAPTPAAAAWLACVQVAVLGQDVVHFQAFAAGALHWTTDFSAGPGPHVYELLFVPQAWSLSLELAFYLLAPLLVWRGLGTVVAVGLASGGFRYWLVRHGLDGDPWNYRFFPCELGVFLLGVAAEHVGARAAERPWWRTAQWPVVVAWFVLLLAAPWCLDTFSLKGRMVLLTAGAVALPFVHTVSATNRLDRGLGELSYPLYLVHMLVLNVLGAWNLDGRHAYWVAPLAAWLLWRTVVVPVERLRSRRARRAAA